MASQAELDGVYMSTALLHSSLSKSRRTKVGAVLVTAQGTTLTGYNGSHYGADNNLEDELPDGTLVTKSDTLHAEINCVLKAAREGISVINSTIYVNLAPCLSCSAMLIQAGVKRVVYLNQYRDDSGVNLLKKSSRIQVEQFKK